MKTILLVLDNSIEFEFAKTILTKTGFNVLSRQYGADITAKLHNNFPDVVVLSHFGNNQKLEDLVKLKTTRGVPKFMWVGAPERYKKLEDATKTIIDRVMESPIQPEKMLEGICELTGLSSEEIIKNYRSLYKSSEAKGKAPMAATSDREARYKSILENVEAKDMVFSSKELKKRSDLDAGDKNTTNLLDQKKEFLRTLFKK
ncbi:MAG: hypothetical protein K2Q26_00405 [Bdellovibrionales bacterium]|nr:hypothetical protein [Bdellovibrionales bacterium]